MSVRRADCNLQRSVDMTHKKRTDNMPEQHTWKIVALLHEHAPWLMAGVLAMFTAALRTYHDTGRITGRDVSEWVLCGVFVASSRPVWAEINIGDGFAVFIGVIVGMLGARVIRVAVETAFKKVAKRFFGGR